MEIKCLYQDNRILVCLKPAGIRSTDEPGGLPEQLRCQLNDPKACLRTVHRLDQVVGGVMVLARSRMAAQLLSQQVADHSFEKEYLAVVQGTPSSPEGEFRDLLGRDKARRMTYVAQEPGKEVREAVLQYRLLEARDGFSLVAVRLLTGRTHQIRCQFSSRGLPLVGDQKYGGTPQEMQGIALWSHSLGFYHPQSSEWVHFEAPPPRCWPWTLFSSLQPQLDVKP